MPNETQKETLSVAVETVLKRNKNGLNARELLEKLEARGGACPSGKTPIATLQALLSTANAKPDGKFVRVDRGKYVVRAATA